MPTTIRFAAAVLALAGLLFSPSCCPTCGYDSAEYEQASAPLRTLRVMTFNIRYDNPADGANAWQHRRDFVAQIIRRARVYAVGLQEALRSQVDELAERLPGWSWVGAGRDDGEQAGEFCPIFYRPSRLELLDSGTFWLSESPQQPGEPGWDGACRRIVTWARFRVPAARSELYLFNTHFDHVGRMARVNSAQLLLERIAEVSCCAPVIVTGDFNCSAGSPPYLILTSAAESNALVDAREASERPPSGPDWTWHGFRGEAGAGGRIDFIFVSEGVRVLDHDTIPDNRDGFYPSDHLPVLAQVQF